MIYDVKKNEKKYQKKVIFFILFIIISFIVLLIYYFSGNDLKSNKQNYNMHDNVVSKSMTNKQDKNVFDENYFPSYKDNNNICGLAVDSNGEKVAVMSTHEDCPTEDMLERNNYKYIKTIDNYHPLLQSDGTCGEAHLVKDSSLLSDKDIAKLQNKIGNLNHLSVNTDSDICPTVSELSDVIKSSLGIVLHFIYNDINLNEDNYSVINFDDNKRIKINKINKDDVLLETDFANPALYHDMYNDRIPKVYVNSDSMQLCKSDMSDCFYNSDDFYLINKKTYEEYHLMSHNGYNIPKTMITKKSYDLCQGDYLQCDLNSNDDNEPILVNISTNEIYTKPKDISVEQES